MSSNRLSLLTRGALILGMIVALALVMGGLPGSVSAAPSCTTDCYVSPTGDNNNAGDAANPLLTIQAAVNQVSPGGTVHVAAGTYAEAININKWLVLSGAGNGSDPASNTRIIVANTDAITLRGSGQSAVQRLVISDLRVTSNMGVGIKILDAGGSYTTIDTVTSTGNATNGLEFQHPATNIAQDFEILNSDLSNNTGGGLRFATFTQMDGLKVADTNLNGNSIGFIVYTDNGTTTPPRPPAKPIFNNITFTNVSMANNRSHGAFIERMNNASFDNITVTGNNTNGTPNVQYGFLMYLRHEAFNNVSITNSTFGNNASASGDCCTDLSLGRTNGGTLTNLTISHNDFSGTTPYGIYIPAAGYDIATTHINRNSFTGTHKHGAVFVAGAPATPYDAACNWWGAADGPSGAGPGSGSKVTANVSYTPMLLTDDLDGPCSANVTVSAPDDLICGAPVEMTIDLSNVSNLYGYEFKVNYDATKVSAAGQFITGWFNGVSPLSGGAWDAKCSNGVCQFASTLLNPQPAVTGGGPVAKITFTPSAAGSFTAAVNSVLLTNLDGDAMPANLDDATFDFDVCGQASVSGKVSLQGRATPMSPGFIKLIDTSNTFPAIDATFDAAGNFNVPNIPVMAGGTPYVIQATHYLYLGNQKALPLNPGDALTGHNTRLLGGDANNSGFVFTDPLVVTGPNVALGVSVADVGCIGSDFGGTTSNTCNGATGVYFDNSGTDINADGKINIQDLSIAGGNFEKNPFQNW